MPTIAPRSAPRATPLVAAPAGSPDDLPWRRVAAWFREGRGGRLVRCGERAATHVRLAGERGPRPVGELVYCPRRLFKGRVQ